MKKWAARPPSMLPIFSCSTLLRREIHQALLMSNLPLVFHRSPPIPSYKRCPLDSKPTLTVLSDLFNSGLNQVKMLIFVASHSMRAALKDRAATLLPLCLSLWLLMFTLHRSSHIWQADCTHRCFRKNGKDGLWKRLPAVLPYFSAWNHRGNSLGSSCWADCLFEDNGRAEESG